MCIRDRHRHEGATDPEQGRPEHHRGEGDRGVDIDRRGADPRLEGDILDLLVDQGEGEDGDPLPGLRACLLYTPRCV